MWISLSSSSKIIFVDKQRKDGDRHYEDLRKEKKMSMDMRSRKSD